MSDKNINLKTSVTVIKKTDRTESVNRLYNAYCDAVSVVAELARMLGIKQCEKCGRKMH